MRHIPATAIFLSLAIAGAGCHASIQHLPPSEATSERFVQKNYEIGKTAQAFIGEPMVRVKDYTLTRSRAPTVTASKSGIIRGGPISISITEGMELPVIGVTEALEVESSAPLNLGGQHKHERTEIPAAGEVSRNRYYYVALVPLANLKLLISEEGTVHTNVLNSADNVIMAYTFKPEPPDITFERKMVEQVSTKAGFTNFELIYTGKSDKTLTLVYREYTPDNIARPAFSQNLIYEADAKMLRFKAMQIEVLAATNEKIAYRVLTE